MLSLNDLPANYDIDDILPAIRGGLSVDGKLYAAPFYGESSRVMYRKDLMEKAGLETPKAPTWDFIAKAARAMTDKDGEIYGACFRSKADWGKNMAFLGVMSNSFGARWFDMDLNPQFDSKEWADNLNFDVDLLNDAGLPGVPNNGFNENLALFQTGHCGIVRNQRRKPRLGERASGNTYIAV
ncbi:MAG: sorbitol/mannitol transport system substrate-binding protein [Paracoccaceae bacterium]